MVYLNLLLGLFNYLNKKLLIELKIYKQNIICISMVFHLIDSQRK